MRIISLFTVVHLSICCDLICPKTWASGNSKCFRYLPEKRNLRDSMKECTRMGGKIFTPNSKDEIIQLEQISRTASFGLNWGSDIIWIGFKVVDTSSRSFPPTLASLRGKTPRWVADEKNNDNGTGKNVWNPKVKQTIKSGKNRNRKYTLIRSKNGLWMLGRKAPKTKAAVVCELKKVCQLTGNGDICWQPASTVYNSVVYTGKKTNTESGYTCASWNDESMHSHNYLETTDHNYCRNPDNGTSGPWCYINSAGNRWDHCSVPLCQDAGNEFVISQSSCGMRPIIDNNCIISVRSLTREVSRNVQIGEAPFHARIRWVLESQAHPENPRDGASIHNGGTIASGALITSCWVLTSKTDSLKDIEGEKIRVDVGNRYYYTDEHSPDKEEDLANHQTLMVYKIFTHEDIALIQLYPTDDSGRCARFSRTVQSACISKDIATKNAGKKCFNTGWRDDLPILNYAQLNITNNLQKCQDIGAGFLDNEKDLCANVIGDTEQISSNLKSGDFGGPLVCVHHEHPCEKYDLVGLLKYISETPTDPAVFTSVSKYYLWIKTHIGENSPVVYNHEFVCETIGC